MSAFFFSLWKLHARWKSHLKCMKLKNSNSCNWLYLYNSAIQCRVTYFSSWSCTAWHHNILSHLIIITIIIITIVAIWCPAFSISYIVWATKYTWNYASIHVRKLSRKYKLHFNIEVATCQDRGRCLIFFQLIIMNVCCRKVWHYEERREW